MPANKNDKRLLFAFILGNSASMVPSVAIAYGIAQFKFIAVVGEGEALAAFSHTQGLITLLLILLLPCLGRMVDRFPIPGGTRYYWSLLGNIFGMLSLYGFVYSSTSQEIFLAWLGIVASYSLSGNAFKAAVPELIPENRLSSVSGKIGATVPLMLALNIIIVLGLFAESELSTKLLILGTMQLIFSIIAMVIISRYHRQRKTQTGEGKPPQTSGKSYRQFAFVIVAKVFLNIAISGTSLLSLYYVTRFAMSQSDVFTLNAIMSLGVILILITGGGSVYLAERYQRPKTFLALGTLFIAFGLLGYALALSVWQAVVAGIFIQLGLGPVSALVIALVNRSLPCREHYARDIAIADTAHSIGAALIHFAAPALVAVGAKMMSNDGYTLYFYTLMGCSLLFVVMLTFINNADHARKHNCI